MCRKHNKCALKCLHDRCACHRLSCFIHEYESFSSSQYINASFSNSLICHNMSIIQFICVLIASILCHFVYFLYISTSEIEMLSSFCPFSWYSLNLLLVIWHFRRTRRVSFPLEGNIRRTFLFLLLCLQLVRIFFFSSNKVVIFIHCWKSLFQVVVSFVKVLP